MFRLKTIYALGFFDGVHLGHQALLAECVRLAEEQNCRPGAFTFYQHPQSLFGAPPPLLNTDADRDLLLRRYGIGPILKYPVTPAVMATPWQAFLEDLVERDAAGFVCGYDFRFGAGGRGDAQALAGFCRERDIPFRIVAEQRLEGIRISSTGIREWIEAGEMERAVQFLGHPHILSGTVVHGRHLGRTIGVPTANMLIPADIAVPRRGVYACTCVLAGRRYRAVTNIGTRPTVQGHQTRAESWILDYNGDLYGQSLTLEFQKYLRPERKFDSLETLRRQIQTDADNARQLP